MSYYNRRATSAINGNSIRSETPLTNDQLMRVTPSVFATEAYQDRSAKYAFTSTIDKIELLRTEGFEPFFAAQSKPRIQDKLGHTKHMVRLRKPGAIQSEVAEEIVLVNDSSGMTSDIVFFGLFRGVCQNGLIAGSVVNEMRVHHRGNAHDNVIEGVYTVLDQAGNVAESVDNMKALTLSHDEQRLFATEALKIRWDEGEAPIPAQDLLFSRRAADREPTLWNVFNRAQENLIKGGLHGRNKSSGRTTTRAINSVNEQVRVNRELWTLADEFAAFRQSRAAA